MSAQKGKTKTKNGMPDLALVAPPRIAAGPRLRGQVERITSLVMRSEKLSAELQPYAKACQAWLEAAQIELAEMAGGYSGPIQNAALGSAAWAMCWSRWMMVEEAKKEYPDLRKVEAASRLADAARLNSFAGYELAIRIARAQGNASTDPLDAVSVPEGSEARMDRLDTMPEPP